MTSFRVLFDDLSKIVIKAILHTQMIITYFHIRDLLPNKPICIFFKYVLYYLCSICTLFLINYYQADSLLISFSLTSTYCDMALEVETLAFKLTRSSDYRHHFQIYIYLFLWVGL